MAWARSRGTALVLVAQRPRNGANVEIPDPGELVAYNSEAIGMLITENTRGQPAVWKQESMKKSIGTALRSPANRVVCPANELPELRARLGQNDCPRAILDSHLIDSTAHQYLVAGDLQSFFEHRREVIIEAEKRWAKERGGTVQFLPDSRTYAKG